MTMAPNFTFFENIFTKSVQDKKDVQCSMPSSHQSSFASGFKEATAVLNTLTREKPFIVFFMQDLYPGLKSRYIWKFKDVRAKFFQSI